MQYLATFQEALIILEELAPTLTDVRANFSEDMKMWTRFRDDAAHVADRTFRLPLRSAHDAAVQDEFGPGASILVYDISTDNVTTGAGSSMVLVDALKRIDELVECLGSRLAQDNAKGLIARPSEKRHREFLETLNGLASE